MELNFRRNLFAVTKDCTWSLLRIAWIALILSIVPSSSAPVIRRVVVGYSVTLQCYPDGFTLTESPSIIQWTVENNLSPVLQLLRHQPHPRAGLGYEGRVSFRDIRNLSASGGVDLVIQDVRRSDKGKYTCQIWDVNGHSLTNGTAWDLDVLSTIPVFVEEPRSALVAVGQVAEFTCVTEPPADLITFVGPNGQTYSPGSSLPAGDSDVVMSGNGRLHVTASRDRRKQRLQQGQYRCVGVWAGAKLFSRPANFTIAGIQDFPPQTNVEVKALKGSTTVIPGIKPESSPPAVLSVLHNNTAVKNTSRYLFLRRGNLHIGNVQPSDAGAYQWVAMNPLTGDTVRSKQLIVLKVLDSIEPQAPALVVSPQELNTVKVGDNLTLECATISNPIAPVVWSRNGRHLPADRFTQKLGNLYLHNVRPSDAGMYSCQSNNGVGADVSAIAEVNVLEIPDIHKWQQEYEVRELDEITLECLTRGSAKPYVSWWHEGLPVVTNDNVTVKESRVVIRRASREHAGFYQCFATNAAGTAAATTRVRVIPKDTPILFSNHHGGGGKHHRDRGVQLNGSLPSTFGSNFQDDFEEHPDIKHNHHKRPRKKKKNKKKDKNNPENVVMIPPTRPEINKVSDESVMVRWDVPPNSGLPILFFKVQYKDVSKPNSRWMTIDDDIAPHIRSYEVVGLKTSHQYRFRLAAVYSNNDNKLGPNSIKFLLEKDPQMKKPTTGPMIVKTETVSQSAINIFWEYIQTLDAARTDGFFIYYRATTSAGDYSKVTVLGDNTRTHILTHLLPDTVYDIKMQAFNLAGTSDFSNIRTEKTAPSADSHGSNEVLSERTYDSEEVPAVSSTAMSTQLLYTLLGSGFGTIVIALLLFVGYCNWKQRKLKRQRQHLSNHSKRKCLAAASAIEAEHQKYAAINGNSPLHLANGHANGQIHSSKINDDLSEQGMMETDFTTITAGDDVHNNNIDHHTFHGSRIQVVAEVRADMHDGSHPDDNDDGDEDSATVAVRLPLLMNEHDPLHHHKVEIRKAPMSSEYSPQRTVNIS